MFDGLGRRDDGRVQHRLVGDFADDVVGFLDDAVDRRAINALGFGVMQFEDLFKAFDMVLGFTEMGLAGLA